MLLRHFGYITRFDKIISFSILLTYCPGKYFAILQVLFALRSMCASRAFSNPFTTILGRVYAILQGFYLLQLFYDDYSFVAVLMDEEFSWQYNTLNIHQTPRDSEKMVCHFRKFTGLFPCTSL